MCSDRRREWIQKRKFPVVKRLSNNCSRKRKQHIMLEEAQESRASHQEHEIGQSGDVYHVALTGTWGRDYGLLTKSERRAWSLLAGSRSP